MSALIAKPGFGENSAAASGARRKRTSRRAWNLGLWLAVGLAGLGGGCGDDWEERANQAYRQGYAHEMKAHEEENRGKRKVARKYFKQAVAFFENSLRANPYHPEANRRIATILDQRLTDVSRAVVYYGRYLDLKPHDPTRLRLARNRLNNLQKIHSGQREDPAAAVRDFIWGARHKSKHVFIRERLSANMVSRMAKHGTLPERYLDKWNERIAGRTCTPVYREVTKVRDEWQAVVIVELAAPGKKSVFWELDFHLTVDGMWELYRAELL